MTEEPARWATSMWASLKEMLVHIVCYFFTPLAVTVSLNGLTGAE